MTITNLPPSLIATLAGWIFDRIGQRRIVARGRFLRLGIFFPQSPSIGIAIGVPLIFGRLTDPRRLGREQFALRLALLVGRLLCLGRLTPFNLG